MSKLTPFQQALASNMGQEKLDSDNLVTLVRRKVVLEEIVVTREEYEKLNKNVASNRYLDGSEFYWSELDWKNADSIGTNIIWLKMESAFLEKCQGFDVKVHRSGKQTVQTSELEDQYAVIWD